MQIQIHLQNLQVLQIQLYFPIASQAQHFNNNLLIIRLSRSQLCLRIENTLYFFRRFLFKKYFHEIRKCKLMQIQSCKPSLVMSSLWDRKSSSSQDLWVLCCYTILCNNLGETENTHSIATIQSCFDFLEITSKSNKREEI